MDGPQTNAPIDPALLADLADWSAIPHQDPPLNLILLSLDTTRQDRLSCYGFDRKTTPNLDRLSDEGVLFERAATAVPLTLPSHATMLTGLHPFEHGVRHNGAYTLADSFLTLSELLKGRGYDTGMIAGAFPLDHRFGLDQGFDHYDDRFSALSRRQQGDLAERPAEEVTRLALQWLDARDHAPFFLWAHYFDPHAPYHPPEPFLGRFPGDPYAGEVAYMDAEIGKLLDGLRARKLMKHTVILVAADHGEGLGDHDELTHSVFIYGATQRVPLIVWFPRSGPFTDGIWRKRQVTELVGLIDLMPTAWNALGLPPDELPRIAGKSLLPLIEGRGTGHDWLYHETLAPDLDFGLSELRGLETATWKYIRAPRSELYNLKDDPGELDDLATEFPDRVEAMEAELARILESESVDAPPSAMDAETIRKLRSLGYLGEPTERADSRAERADPKDEAEVGMVVARAQTMAEHHRTVEALAVLDSLLSVHPGMRQALRLRASYLVELDRGREAIAAYDRALADCNGCPYERQLLQERVTAYRTARMFDVAREQVDALLARFPEEKGLHLTSGELHEEAGHAEAARADYRREAELFPLEPLPVLKLGMLEASLDRPDRAESAYREALRIDPDYVDALVVLSESLSLRGRNGEADALLDRAMALEPRNPAVLFRKAKALETRGRNTEAISSYRAALEAMPTNALIWFNLGALYGKTGQLGEASNCYQKAIDTGDAPVGAYVNLGVVHGQAGRLREAIQLWEEALSRNPPARDAEVIRNNLRQAEEMLKARQ